MWLCAAEPLSIPPRPGAVLLPRQGITAGGGPDGARHRPPLYPPPAAPSSAPASAARRVTSASRSRSSVRLRDAATGKPAGELKGHEGPVSALAYGPDGKWLASGGYDRTVRLWPLADGSARVLRGSEGRVTSVAFTPDGGSLVGGGSALTEVRIDGRVVDRVGHADYVRVWDLGGGKPAREPEVRGSAVTLLPGGRVLAAGLAPLLAVKDEWLLTDGADTVTIADLATGKVLARLERHGRTAAVSPDGRTVACGGDSVLHLAGNVVDSEPGHGISQGMRKGEKVESFTIDPGLRGPNNIIGGGTDPTLTLRDPAALQERAKFDGVKSAAVLAFSPEGALLASGDTAGVVRLHRVPPPKP
jgi:WD40 repeat protein